jgi:hypothetical protein
MSDRPLTDSMKNLRARMASLAGEMSAEIDQQISDLDKMRQIAKLQGELGFDDPALNDTIDAFEKAAKLIKTQLETPLPEETEET